MARKAARKTETEKVGSKIQPWTPRTWAGMNAGGWFRLLARNRFAVSPSRVGMVLIQSGLGLFNSFLGLVQRAIYGRRIARTQIKHDPIFIIGHWRSGTTLLHELLVQDSRHAYPNTYACFAANHFLVSWYLLAWWVKFLIPARRPMDNMRVGLERPQEDEFALCNMGLPSPYLKFAFGNHPPQDEEYLDLEQVPPEALARWKRGFVWFLKCVTLQNPKRIVLKSPTHTARIKVLLELFPNARFVHIVRDPFVVFPSTLKTWKQFYRDHGAQVPRFEGFEEHVFTTFLRMYDAFDRSRGQIDPSRFCEVRYEDLVKDPVEEVRKIYERLGLGAFENMVPALERYAAQTADYKTNRHELTPETREAIAHRWGPFIRKYGYGSQPETGRLTTRENGGD